MKKSLFFAIAMAFAATAFVACGSDPDDPKKEDPKESKITGLTVKPAAITLAEGSIYDGNGFTLTPIVEPAGEKGIFTWASSDTTVVYVDSLGTIYTINAGDAVVTCTETTSGLKAESKIHVTSYLESFSFGEAMPYGFSLNDTVGAHMQTIKASNGAEYTCYFLPTEFMIFSKGFFINGSGYYDGAEEALVITLPSYMWYAPKELNGGQGTMFCLGTWEIDAAALADGYAQYANPGALDADFVKMMTEAYKAYNDQDYASFSANIKAAGEHANEVGASMTVWSYDCDEDDPENCGYSRSYIPDAILTDGIFDVTNGLDGTSDYMIKLDGCRFTFQPVNGFNGWGIDATYDEENDQINQNSNEVQLGAPITMEFGKVNEEKAPRFIEIPVNEEMMKAVEKINEAVKNNDLKSLRRMKL